METPAILDKNFSEKNKIPPCKGGLRGKRMNNEKWIMNTEKRTLFQVL